MSNTTTITDRRLLAALDYIDQKYIDDVFSIIKEPEADTPVPVRSWRTPLKHSKIYIALVASLLLLAMASPLVSFFTYVVSNFTAGAGSGTTNITTQVLDDINEIEIDMCQAYVDYDLLTPALIKEINTAWIERNGSEQLLIESIDALKYDTQSGELYLGYYNGYYIFESGYGVISTGQTYHIANHVFSTGASNFEIVGYKDGNFTCLSDLYESGELSYTDIAVINDRFYELSLYVIALQHFGETIHVSVPQIPDVQLDEEKNQIIKKTLIRYIPEINNVTASTDDVYITEYYGDYNGAYVFNYRTSLINYSGHSIYYENIGNEKFVYYGDQFSPSGKSDNFRLYVYYDNSIYTLSEAYEKSLLTDSDVSMIKKYHTAYHPFYLDVFTDLKSFSPKELK